jgi:hypothetical protein
MVGQGAEIALTGPAADLPRRQGAIFLGQRQSREHGNMMTVTFGLIAISCFFLWYCKAEWGWAAVMIALIIGIIIFMGDVDFSTNLGVQL